MKQIVLPILILIICSCGTKIHYVYKHPAAPMAIPEIRSDSFGVVSIGEGISGIYEVIRNDISYYQGKESDIAEIQIKVDQIDSLESGELNRILLNNNEKRFILIVIQDEPEIARNHYKKWEGEEYTDKYGNSHKVKKDREIYSTSIAVSCKIILYDCKKQIILAKSSERFSQNVENEISDWFHDNTLFGVIEDVLKMGQKVNEDRYPEITQIESWAIQGYFVSFLEGIES